MKTLEIKIPELGKQKGTLAWTAKELEKINNNLKFCNTTDGCPAVFFTEETKDGEEKYCFLMRIDNGAIEDYGTWDHGKVRIINIVEEPLAGIEGLFSVLNEAAKEKVKEYLKTLAEEFQAKWEAV